MVVKESDEKPQPIRTIYLQNVELERILMERVVDYKQLFENLPSHKGWFNWKFHHRMVIQLVIGEMEWERYTRLISEDPEHSRPHVSARKIVAADMRQLRKDLEFPGRQIARLKPAETKKSMKDRMKETAAAYKASTMPDPAANL